ncbi:hypothetical protein [Alteromonas sp. CYL-A6]|uniref:hypothetical protein n=1 Tax=Alteromonas nitratireducens TaxID=3390813 RepID=UPI0034B752FD
MVQRVDICPCCRRKARLTFHHLIPKQMHRRRFFRKTLTRDERNEGIAICRQCHDGIHRFYSPMELAKSLNTLEKLLADEQLAGYFHWVSKQRIRLD